MSSRHRAAPAAWGAAACAWLNDSAYADTTATLNTGDTAWLITATALVLFMTLPGLALFYAGLVRTKNVLSILMQCFGITCVVSLLWLVAAYGLTFGDGGGAQGGKICCGQEPGGAKKTGRRRGAGKIEPGKTALADPGAEKKLRHVGD